jgi:phosphoribosylformimino-5-aminoimidazole carboxamide ribotide isomerase
MILFPAIDIKNGECVRLKLGNLNESTTYNNNPLSQAKIFEEIGFSWLHIVDLDAAVNGKSKNFGIIKNIVKNTNLSIQLGGGIRSMEQIDFWSNLGVKRIVLGTVSVTDIELVKEAALKYKNKIVLALDTKGELVWIEGWKKNTNINVYDLVSKYQNLNIEAILHTDINRDGMLEGLNFDGSRSLANRTKIPIILSGGLSSIQDIKELTLKKNKIFSGAIIGKAIYEKKIDPKQALDLIKKGDF